MKKLLLIFLLLFSQLSFSQTADEYYKMAQNETEFENLKLEFLNQALVVNPKHFLARFERAGLLIPIDSLKAITDINTLIKQNPKVDSLFAYRAIFYKLLKNYPLSINDLNLYLSKHPNSFDGLNHRAECYFGLRQYAKAFQDLDKAFLFANSNSQKALVYQSKGDISFAKKDTTESIAYWEKSLTFVENVEQLETIASTLKEQGKYQLALQKINRLLVLKPNESKFWMEKAAIESFDKVINYQSMVQSIRKALEIEPDCIYCLKMLKSIQTLTNQTDEVIQTMEKLAVLEPDSAGVIRTEILNLKIKLKRYDEVFKDIDLAIKKDSINKKAYLFNKIKIKRDIGKPNDALSDVEILIQDYPNETEYQILKNTLLAEANRSEEAIDDCNKQILVRPNDFVIYHNRATIYANLKKWKKANDDINMAIQLAKKNQKADSITVAELLGRKYEIKINQKDTLEALKAINEAILKSPTKEFLTSRGTLYFTQKKYNEFIEDYSKLIQQEPNNYDFISSLCNGHILNNNLKYGFEIINTAIKNDSTNGCLYMLRAMIIEEYSTDYQTALKDINRAFLLNNCTKKSELYRTKGIILRVLELFDEAIPILSKAIEINDLDATNYLQRGMCYNETSKYELAFQDYNKAISINPKFVRAYVRLGVEKYQNAKNIEEKAASLEFINKGIELSTKDEKIDLMILKALILINDDGSKPTSNAILASKKMVSDIIELTKNSNFMLNHPLTYSQYLTLQGFINLKEEKNEDAKQYFLSILKIQNVETQTRRNAFMQLSIIAELEDKLKESYQYIDTLIMLYDNNQKVRDEVLLYKAKILSSHLEFDKAREIIDKIALDNQNATLWNYVNGLLAGRERNYEKAIRNFNSALESLESSNLSLFRVEKDKIYESRGSAYLKYSFYDDALSDFNKALKINPKNKEAIAGKKKAQDGLDGKLPLIATSQEINEKPSEIKEVFPAYPKRVALVVGNSNYSHATKLDQKPINDAEDIGKRLKDLGFDVIKVLDATYEDLRKAVNSWSKKIVGADIALLFYGGHGLEEDGKNYLLPIDAQIENAEDISGQGYPLNQLIEMLDKNNPTFSVLILDACRNNPFKGTKNRSIGDNNSRGFKNVEVKKGSNNRFVAMATAPTTVAQQGGRNGVYTSALLKHLQKGIRLEDVFLKVRQEVIEQTNKSQIPEQSSSMNKTFAF